jgi:magnesium and cobalt transporter
MSDEPPGSSEPNRSGWWQRLFPGRDDQSEGRARILEFLRECRDEALLEPGEFAMLEGVLEVSETKVRDIMIPRSHMVVLEHDAELPELIKSILDSGHSRFPVIGEDRDQVTGILLAKDLLRSVAVNAGTATLELNKLLRPVVFIPESKRLSTLLSEFRESHNHMAIVVDEYGGVAGLATIEDVLEQIVGDIDDEHDPEEVDYIQRQGEDQYLVRALTRIEDFNDYFKCDLEDEEYDTVGGLVMHELGRLPRRGELLECYGFVFRVLRADRRRIESLEVTRLPESVEPGEQHEAG